MKLTQVENRSCYFKQPINTPILGQATTKSSLVNQISKFMTIFICRMKRVVRPH